MCIMWENDTTHIDPKTIGNYWMYNFLVSIVAADIMILENLNRLI